MARKRLLWQLYPSYVLVAVTSLVSVGWYGAYLLEKRTSQGSMVSYGWPRSWSIKNSARRWPATTSTICKLSATLPPPRRTPTWPSCFPPARL